MKSLNKTKNTRNYAFDNMKFILIFCVVFGHILEFVPVLYGDKIYRLIYSFHMPLFIFISGYFAKFNKRKIVFNYFFLYIIFQVLYITFEKIVFKSDITYQFMQPHWILWYLFVMIMYSILIPLYDTNSTKNQVLIIAFCLLLALYKGNEKGIVYNLSISRFFVFQPYFVMGYYLKKEENKIEKFFTNLSKTKKIVSLSVITALTVCSSYFMIFKDMPPEMLYGSYLYTSWSDVLTRGILFVISMVFIIFFFVVLKKPLNRKIPLISSIGKNTLPIFLLHGFILKLLKHGFIKIPSSYFGILIYVITILILFGNNFIAKLFRFKKRAYQSPAQYINLLK